MQMLYILVVFVYCLLPVDGLCYYPCPRQGKTLVRVIGPKGFSKFSCKHPFKVMGNDGEVRECYARAGPFIVQRRNNNEFRVIKEMSVDPTGQVVIIYLSQWTYFHHNPDMCDVVAAGKDWYLHKFVAEPPTGYRPRKDLGCNVPIGCPVTNPYKDIPCTACLPNEDDGLCCASCQGQHKRYY